MYNHTIDVNLPYWYVQMDLISACSSPTQRQETIVGGGGATTAWWHLGKTKEMELPTQITTATRKKSCRTSVEASSGERKSNDVALTTTTNSKFDAVRSVRSSISNEFSTKRLNRWKKNRERIENTKWWRDQGYWVIFQKKNLHFLK